MKIEFDEHDYRSVENAISELYKVKKQLLKDNISLSEEYKKDNLRYHRHLAAIEKAYNCIKRIYSTDISNLYESSSTPEYYVYAHCNPLRPLRIKFDEKHAFSAIDLGLTHEPFYIGKGTGNRCFDLNRNEGHRKIKNMIESASKEVMVVKLKENLHSHEALAIESKIIDILGLRSLNQYSLLVNLDEGKMPAERRSLYPKGSSWYLNRNKMALYKKNSV